MRICELFFWRLSDIIPHLPVIKAAGFDAILISPLQPLLEDEINENFKWWHFYQPIGFSIGNVLGSKSDLYQVSEECHKNGLYSLLDTVLNHVAGSKWDNLEPHEKVDPNLRNNPYLWKEKRMIQNWDDRYQVTHYCMGLPGIQSQNYDFQEIAIHLLNEAIECGVDGFRFDAAKCIALPSEGCDFWPRVLGRTIKKEELFLMGEILNPKSMPILKEYSNYFNILTESPRGLPIEQTVICAYSHDNHYTDLPDMNFSWKSDDLLRMEYANMTKYPNTLYFPRNGLADLIHPEIVLANQSAKEKQLIFKRSA